MMMCLSFSVHDRESVLLENRKEKIVYEMQKPKRKDIIERKKRRKKKENDADVRKNAQDSRITIMIRTYYCHTP
jgi:hypothetical protein